eukprot:384975-Rhodomonas_salina.1
MSPRGIRYGTKRVAHVRYCHSVWCYRATCVHAMSGTNLAYAAPPIMRCPGLTEQMTCYQPQRAELAAFGAESQGGS